jgi:hypothetical protein
VESGCWVETEWDDLVSIVRTDSEGLVGELNSRGELLVTLEEIRGEHFNIHFLVVILSSAEPLVFTNPVEEQGYLLALSHTN